MNPDCGLQASAYAHFSDKTQKHINYLIDIFKSTKSEQALRLSSLSVSFLTHTHDSFETYDNLTSTPLIDSNDKPRSRLAAVLVLLYEQEGNLRVLLTTRAKQLRTHGGETSLPGGKMDEGDTDIIGTAFREASEEIGLPLQSPHVHILGTLPLLPFHSLIVTPVVVLLSDNAVLDSLKAGEGEVDHIFSYPLEAILRPELAVKLDTLVPRGSQYWTYESEYHHHIDYTVKALGDVTYRVHCYQTSASPITGMTSDVLIRAAEMTYRREPQFERYAADQLRTYEAIVEAYEANIGVGSNRR